jgi:hypothetical protein
VTVEAAPSEILSLLGRGIVGMLDEKTSVWCETRHSVHTSRGRPAVARLRGDDHRRVLSLDHIVEGRVSRVERDGVCKRLVHMMGHAVDRERLIHSRSRTRTVRVALHE